MTPEQRLHDVMVNMYQRAGKEAGYWGNYFLRSVKRHGGLATAKRMLQPRRGKAVQKGLRALIDARRVDLSLEAVALRPEFKSLFTPDELKEARHRLDALPKSAVPRMIAASANYPETLPDDVSYVEGSVRRVSVNAHERDPRARDACVKHHGTRCAVCHLSFEERYGPRGRGFIHVHHRKPLALMHGPARLNPVKDLVPVCPNCHAMLHTQDPPLSVDELKAELGEHAG